MGVVAVPQALQCNESDSCVLGGTSTRIAPAVRLTSAEKQAAADSSPRGVVA